AWLVERLLQRMPGLARLVGNGWLWLASQNPDTGEMVKHTAAGAHHYQPRPATASADDSVAYFQGKRGPLVPASLAR
ncbi:MAG: hypothetical protein KC910_35390, partial [Candidatus Eremiobacteraeota bacterium]|nr:hypothetical protein [Candidatus Eremiobacteraeota bacterium]